MTRKVVINPIFITTLGAIITLVSTFYVAKAQTENNTCRIEKIESKCEKIEVMANDVTWIKNTLDKMQNAQNRRSRG